VAKAVSQQQQQQQQHQQQQQTTTTRTGAGYIDIVVVVVVAAATTAATSEVGADDGRCSKVNCLRLHKSLRNFPNMYACVCVCVYECD